LVIISAAIGINGVIWTFWINRLILSSLFPAIEIAVFVLLSVVTAAGGLFLIIFGLPLLKEVRRQPFHTRQNLIQKIVVLLVVLSSSLPAVWIVIVLIQLIDLNNPLPYLVSMAVVENTSIFLCTVASQYYLRLSDLKELDDPKTSLLLPREDNTLIVEEATVRS